MTDPLTNQELARQLHRAVLEELNTRIAKGRVPVELLQVARRFLRDNGQLGGLIEPGERERLEAMHAQYIARLEEALRTDRPSAAVLMEARKFLEAHSVNRAAGATADGPTQLDDLEDADLPFQ